MPIDQDVREYLNSIKRGDQEILKIFTKADKLNQKELGALRRDHPKALIISNLKKSGIPKATDKIFEQLFFKKCD
jgi:GTP-binding protein